LPSIAIISCSHGQSDIFSAIECQSEIEGIILTGVLSPQKTFRCYQHQVEQKTFFVAAAEGMQRKVR
jgi:predicted phosphodiesterase